MGASDRRGAGAIVGGNAMTHQRHAKELRAEGAATGVGDSADAADLASLDATVIDHRCRGSCKANLLQQCSSPQHDGRREKLVRPQSAFHE